jgi:L-ascorbate metabolism protein UlaG (beta-lactamase superfamily)
VRRAVALAAAGVALAALAAANPYYDASKPHHTPEGFRNTDGKALEDPGFWRWQWERRNGGLAAPPPGGWRFEALRPDLDFLRANRTQFSATWLGHATVLVQMGGVNLIADPQFSERASPLAAFGPKRVMPLTFAVEELPHIDVVLISHNHYDHLDLDTVKALATRHDPRPLFLVPLGLKGWFAARGITRVEELDWWQSREDAGLRLTFVPVQHWSKRTLWDANRSLWGGWAIAGGGLNVIHTGDLGYSRDSIDVGERLGPFDLALIPIGAYAPRWFMKIHHVDVPEAIQVRADLRAARAIGMHWGTFEHLADEPMDEPPTWLARERERTNMARDQFDVMKVGETRPILAAARR